MDASERSQSSLRIQIPIIPLDLLFNIFLRLPVKSLMRFRCASKQLLALIDDPIFAKEHFARSRKSQADSDVIINYDNALVSVDFHLGEDNQEFANARKLNCPAVIGPEEIVCLVGCCNGIICLVDQKTKNLIFWNPSSGKFRKTEGYEVRWPYPECFCYDSVRDDYKVVRMTYGSSPSFLPNELKIYSVATDSWRKVTEGFPPGWCSHEKGVFVSGAVHWSWLSDGKESLLSFDLGTETFLLIPLPENLSGTYNLSALDQSLCLICHEFPFTSVYVMRDHGVGGSWTLLISLRTNQTVRCLISLPGWNGQVIGTSESGVISLRSGDISLRSGDIDIRGVSGYGECTGQACVCFRSLVPL